ncbi:ABC transporter ATP-binding protein/permease [Clostridium swellfunianum]|uniref:ABC transporter ATP-binding protein n=1 Tax=Clostridium swellfunianum TaxID=1367462 RepID=UPI00202F8B62|nr:ABC transporter ATP-binding protein [Clostridium swellfunianum]MCM0649550.1 ABC transporter ATP-binding protein/permease [Clostridium swellfunianum]
MGSIKWIWKYIKPYSWKMGLGFILVLFCSALNMVNPYISGKIVDKVIIQGDKSLLVMLLVSMIGATFLKSVIRYFFQMTFERVSQNVIFNLREKIYSRLQELDFDFYNQNRTGDIMARMTGDMDAVRHFVAWVVYNVLENAAIFIFAVVMMASISLKFTLILLAVTPLIGFLAYRMTFEVKPTFSAIREQFSKLNSVVQENISGNRVVKAFAKEDYEVEKFTKENQGYRLKNMESAKVWEKYLPVLDSLAGMLSVTMILTGGIMVINKTLTLSELVVFNGLIWALNNPMRMAGWLINDIQRFAASAEKIKALMEVEPKIKTVDFPMDKQRIMGQVEFRNVSFSYENELVLMNINFTAKPGQTVAILGPTGSGKSTLVNLICRFYDVTEGEVLIDEMNIKEWDIKKIRDNTAVAMQDIFLFSDTIEGNIAYGDPQASMDQVRKVAGLAGAHEFITNMPEGYDTIIGERGVGLSGGQKQRIALARALLKNPSILILDDTTSAVDMETEHKIQRALKSVYSNRTNFIIAHRISSVKNADLILVIDKGTIVEKGKHEELLSKKGYYYNVYMNQFGDFDNVKSKEVV